MQNNNEIDQDVLTEFIDESEDALLQIPSLFVAVERDPKNVDLINQIFRPIHSLKGNAAYFGLLKIKVLSHKMETLLDRMRHGQLTVNKEIINLLLQGVDCLIEMLGRSRNNKPEVEGKTAFDDLTERIGKAAETKQGIETGLLQEAVSRLRSLYEILENENHNGKDQVETVVRLIMGTLTQNEKAGVIHTLKSSTRIPEPLKTLKEILSEKFEKVMSDEKSNQVYECLEMLKQMVADPEGTVIIEKAIDDYKTMISTVGFDCLLQEILIEAVEKLYTRNLWKEEIIQGKGNEEAEVKEEKSPDKRSQNSKKTMRVSEVNIDNFLGYVGELIIVREMFKYLGKQLSESEIDMRIIQEFRRANDSFNELSHDLQESIMAIRRIPVRGILQKTPRIVRDIALASGKDIDVIVTGDEVEMDKSLIEALEAPLVHMIRNSADHGIESPKERIQANKPGKGLIKIAITELPDFFEVVISDDGAGIDYSSIRRKAEKLGIIKEDKSLTEEETAGLLFISGLSTAKEVTDVSGRGVGMDVVKRNIDKIGGRIEVRSIPGEGTQFTIKIPKTVGTQIINGFLIRVEDEHFILPSDDIIETFTSSNGDFTDVAGKGMCVKRRGTLIPFINFADILSLNTKGKRKNGNVTIIAVKNRNHVYGLGIDEILGLQEVIVKPVNGLQQQKELFAGAAITGSGEVSMIVDIENILS